MIALILILPILLPLQSALEIDDYIFSSRTVQVKIYSEAPIENIEAITGKAYGIINLKNREIQFAVPMRSLDFKKKLMQEHFNESYIESEKFPISKFKGRIDREINISKDGIFEVVATGTLEIHGISRPRTINGTIKVENGMLHIHSRFTVKCADHNISIPKLVFKNIAETIQVTLNGTFSPSN